MHALACKHDNARVAVFAFRSVLPHPSPASVALGGTRLSDDNVERGGQRHLLHWRGGVDFFVLFCCMLERGPSESL